MKKDDNKESKSKKKEYKKPELKKHSKIKPQPAEIFDTYCCGASAELYA